ncbi:MAG TPA: hypothetical protein VET82_13095 [Candidatus Eisenbacteria bacterium]|nr:hypothetical protein [Candidatus Eisenbacteria bacterium]
MTVVALKSPRLSAARTALADGQDVFSAHYSRVGAAAGTQLYLKARRWVPR